MPPMAAAARSSSDGADDKRHQNARRRPLHLAQVERRKSTTHGFGYEARAHALGHAGQQTPQARGHEEELRPQDPALRDVGDGVIGAFGRSFRVALGAGEKADRRPQMARAIAGSGDHQFRAAAVGFSRMRRGHGLDGRVKEAIRRERSLEPIFFVGKLIGIRKVDERAASACVRVHAGNLGGAGGEIGHERRARAATP
jgi:hypothetical protein